MKFVWGEIQERLLREGVPNERVSMLVMEELLRAHELSMKYNCRHYNAERIDGRKPGTFYTVCHDCKQEIC